MEDIFGQLFTGFIHSIATQQYYLYSGISISLVFGALGMTLFMFRRYFRLTDLVKSGIEVKGEVTGYTNAAFFADSAIIKYVFKDLNGNVCNGKEHFNLTWWGAIDERSTGTPVTVIYSGTDPRLNSLKKYLHRRVKYSMFCSILMALAFLIVVIAIF